MIISFTTKNSYLLQSSVCQVCDWNYTYVTKLELLEEELPVAFSAIGLPEEEFRNSGLLGKKVHATKKLDQTHVELIGQLSPKTKAFLREYYRIDFLLFDYDDSLLCP